MWKYWTFMDGQLHIVQLEYFKSNKYHTEISKKSKMYPWEISYLSRFDNYKQVESTFHSDCSWWKMRTMEKVCQWCQLMLMLMLLKVEKARRKLQDVPSYSLSSLDRCKSSSNARWLKSILLISNPTCFSIGNHHYPASIYVHCTLYRGSWLAVSPFPSSSSPSSSLLPAAMASKCESSSSSYSW